jgi:hypothetical protein
MRWLPVVLVLAAGCTMSDWRKDGATSADLDRDYDECRVSAKPDPAIAAIAGVFGAVGVFVGTSYNDSRLRDCLQAKGWTRNGEPAAAATAVATSPAPAPAPAPAVMPVSATEADSGAAKRLRDLQSLKDLGLITQQEYDERRQAIVRGL